MKNNVSVLSGEDQLAFRGASCALKEPSTQETPLLQAPHRWRSSCRKTKLPKSNRAESGLKLIWLRLGDLKFT